MGTASRDEDSLPNVLLKVPGLHTVLLLQLLQVLAAQKECLHRYTALPSVPARLLQTLNCSPCKALGRQHCCWVGAERTQGGVQGCDLRVDGVLDVAVLDWSAGMAELGAVGHEVGLQLGHILALEDVPNSPCSSVTAPYTLSQLAYEIHIHTHMYTLNPVYIHTLNPYIYRV